MEAETASAEMRLHSEHWKLARAQIEFRQQTAADPLSKSLAFVLDGTTSPTFPSSAGGSCATELKGLHCLPLFWELGHSFSDDQTYYFLSFRHWPKGANYMLAGARMPGAALTYAMEDPKMSSKKWQCSTFMKEYW